MVRYCSVALCCVAAGHVPYLLQGRGHNGHGRLVPSSPVFCNTHILLSHHSVEEERGELNFILFSITGWHCEALGHVPYILLQCCGHNGHGRLVPFFIVFCNNHTLPSGHSPEKRSTYLYCSALQRGTV